MKKFFVVVIALVLAFSLAACKTSEKSSGGSGESNSPDASAAPSDDQGPGAQASGKFENITGMTSEYSRLYDLYSGVLDASEKLYLSLALTEISSGILGPMSYEMLDFMGDDGTFGEKNDMNGFYERHGTEITFGRDHIVNEEEEFGTTKTGDQKIGNGGADLGSGTVWDESSTVRDGEMISHTRFDARFQNGSMTAMNQIGHNFDAKGDENSFNHAVFIIISDNKYEFVTGKATEGASMPIMNFDSGMSVADAKAMIEGAGYTVDFYGNVESGKLTLEIGG